MKENNISEIIKNNSEISIDDLLNKYSTKINGLSIEEAKQRIDKYGKNIINTDNNNSFALKVRDAVINPFNIVLFIVALVSYITDVVIASEPSYATVIMLMLIVIVSGIISFVQSESSNNAINKLQKMIINKVDVIRDNKVIEISIEEVVPGDIIKLSSGDMIPADVRFIEAKDLFLDESQLTGESNPVEKVITSSQNESILELSNIGFMGTNIVSGTAKAIVFSTGNHTYFGSMAKSLSSNITKSSFEKNVDDISGLLIKFMFAMIPIIFLVNFLTKSRWLDSLMFGITIAVGLMPEMLPVIITSSLAKGAVIMSKKKTIVKRLGSIQTFGEMDVFCTDKTGTLTQDKIVLEKYLDVTGKEDKRILKHAFLNSYFQTGLKNLMDVAVINRAEKEELGHLKEEYTREDEIPFDFSRRKMSVVLKDKTGKRQLITKGAVEEVLASCSYIELEGKVEKITQELIDNARKIAENNNNEGIRVLAIAQKNDIENVGVFSVKDECEMVLIGFVGFLDPPKESAKSAIEKLANYGVKTVVLTGDSEGVAINICSKLGLDTSFTLNGNMIEKMSDDEIKKTFDKCFVYAKLNPLQKKRIVKLLQEEGHTVGYMGDGINDGPPLKQADVGISVDNAVDIAKEVADIILLEKDLNVLEEAVVEGRKTFANIVKYLKMAISGNFGNMLSIVVASLMLPFLPLKPIHILIQNLLNDFAQIGMPFDNVEMEYIKKPKKWDIAGLKQFMFSFGMLSTLIDILCFVVLFFVMKYNNFELSGYFQCGWFMYGVISQTLIIHIMRTSKLPFVKGHASKQLMISTIVITLITVLIGFTGIANIFDMNQMPYIFGIWMIALMIVYLVIAQILKRIYIKNNKVWM